jgi:hypothetical protein
MKCGLAAPRHVRERQPRYLQLPAHNDVRHGSASVHSPLEGKLAFRSARVSRGIWWRCLDRSSRFIGRLTGALIPIAASTDTALAFQASY